MEFLKLAKERHSVRKYRSQSVEEAKLQNILEAGRVAPTAANLQPQRFLVVSTPDGLSKLSKAGNIHGAPLAIVVCSLKDKTWKRPQDGHLMGDIDATIATTHMMLQAWSEGVASCWITWFDPAVVRSEFALPDKVIPVNILALGYEDEQEQPSNRHLERIPLSDMVWKESLPCSLK